MNLVVINGLYWLLKLQNTAFSAWFCLCVLFPKTILWISSVQSWNYTSFHQDDQLFRFSQWFDWLHTYSRWRLSCLNLVELQFSTEQNHTFFFLFFFFSFQTSTVIYRRNKLCASGFGFPLLFFFPRKYSDLCSDLCGLSQSPAAPPASFSLLTVAGRALYVGIVSQRGTWPWWRVTLPSNSPRSCIKVWKSRKASLHIFIDVAGGDSKRTRHTNTTLLYLHTRFWRLVYQKYSTLWWVRVCLFYFRMEKLHEYFKSHQPTFGARCPLVVDASNEFDPSHDLASIVISDTI